MENKEHKVFPNLDVIDTNEESESEKKWKHCHRKVEQNTESKYQS